MAGSASSSKSSSGSLLKRLLPTWLYLRVRSVFMTLLSPTMYAAERGYYRSALKGRIVQETGAPAPWLSFPLVAFLESRSFDGRSVLEFGSGQSSLWWAERAADVIALETDAEWTKRVRADAPANLEVVDVPLDYPDQASFDADVAKVTDGRRFDVVVVDGGDRPKGLLAAPHSLTDDGVIILDDVDLHRDLADWNHALDSLKSQGFGSIDFYGMAVGAPYTRRQRCSTILFRDGSFITR